jgi:hypothetical protein
MNLQHAKEKNLSTMRAIAASWKTTGELALLAIASLRPLATRSEKSISD